MALSLGVGHDRPMEDVLDASHPGSADPTLKPDEVALMFSGGLDSTATALALSRTHERVHLVTYRNGYGHLKLDRARARYEDLVRSAGPNFTWTLISTRPLFEELLLKSLAADYRAVRSGFVWCLGCKLAMHARSAWFCLENGLPRMTDGANGETDEMVEQSLLSLSLIRFFYEDLSVEYGAPVYDATRDESRADLRRRGVRTGLTVLGRQLGVQPTCIAGELYYLPYFLLNKPVKHDEDKVAAFFEAKVPRAKEFVREGLRRRGLELDALLAARPTVALAP